MKDHEEAYTKALKWRDWYSVGPPSRWLHSKIVHRLLRLGISQQCKDVAQARKSPDIALFDEMNAAGKDQFETFARQQRGTSGEYLGDADGGEYFEVNGGLGWDPGGTGCVAF
ncbi:hypothetical protein DOTSEDRAFT_21370 [Dothistroma septosporum NZE10]|uniref:Uncharacterized protein n=1 Tax=Dothistroma septosporum (strain NZE10 / CBS 128990) TaxID=675120 RepID=N1PZG2_DOTSN|nr:hypothetical protein DOTSEDRAFT_21370 [Dothistroma septosporum NZE10]